MLYYLGNARTDDQRAEMVRLEKAGICIFCPTSYSYDLSKPEVLLEDEGGTSYKKQVLMANGTWAILRNEYPYDGTLTHIMLVPQCHVSRMDELPELHRGGFWEILDAAVTHFGRGGYYVLGARNGDLRYTAGTIAHLHIQYVVGDPDNDGDPVRLFMSSRPPSSSS